MKYPVYFGTYSNHMYRGEFDETAGSLVLTDSIEIESPSYIIRDGEIIYGVSETDTFKEIKNSGAVFSVSIRNDNEMILISIEATNGKHPCHLCAFEGYIYVSNYSEGTLSIFSRTKEGKIMPSSMSIAHYGSSINPERQTQSHIHFAAMTHDDQYLSVCDLGLDKVFMYQYSADIGLTTNAKVINCPPGSGPRHLVFCEKSKTFYVLSELGNTVLVYKDIDNSNQHVQEISTLPADFTSTSTAAAIRISPDAQTLAVSNRGFDSIAFFKISDDGTLEGDGHIKTGITPRDFSFSPGGKWILSANQDDDTVTIHDTANNGEIRGKLSIPKPSCIAF